MRTHGRAEPSAGAAADCSAISGARAGVAEHGADGEGLAAGSAPASKKQKTLAQMFGKTTRTDCIQEGGEQEREPPGKRMKAEPREVAEVAPTTDAVDLFSANRAEDLAALDWLRTHSEEPRCEDLLQQIMAWSGIQDRKSVV